MKETVNLKVAPCSYEAALYACKNWHYSHTMPSGKILKIGAWENGKYIGCVLFSRGANQHIGSPYGMDQTQVIELTRIALTHHNSPVTKILSKAIEILKKKSHGIKLIVSYADCDQNHKGVIYQASNWIYQGLIQQGKISGYIIKRKRLHNRTISAHAWKKNLMWLRQYVDQNAQAIYSKGKHKYLYPLDKKLRKEMLKLAKPYPK